MSGGQMSYGANVQGGRCPKGTDVIRGRMSWGQMSYGGECPGGWCPKVEKNGVTNPGGKCPGGKCPDIVSLNPPGFSWECPWARSFRSLNSSESQGRHE